MLAIDADDAPTGASKTHRTTITSETTRPLIQNKAEGSVVEPFDLGDQYCKISHLERPSLGSFGTMIYKPMEQKGEGPLGWIKNETNECNSNQAELRKQGGTMLCLGNPGVGKTSLLNSLMHHTSKFKTPNAKIVPGAILNNTIFGDSSGIVESVTISTTDEIQQALRLGGHYQLIFVLTTEAGRIRLADRTLIERVLEALNDVPRLSHGIVINKVTKGAVRKYEDPKFSNSFLSTLNIGWINTPHVFLYPKIDEAEDVDDFLLPRNHEFENFIAQIEPVFIEKDLVRNIRHIETALTDDSLNLGH